MWFCFHKVRCVRYEGLRKEPYVRPKRRGNLGMRDLYKKKEGQLKV